MANKPKKSVDLDLEHQLLNAFETSTKESLRAVKIRTKEKKNIGVLVEMGKPAKKARSPQKQKIV